MGKYEKLEAVSQCPICTINVYLIDNKVQPQVMPCGIGGEPRKIGAKADGVKLEPSADCPYESETERLAIKYSYDHMIGDLHRDAG